MPQGIGYGKKTISKNTSMRAKAIRTIGKKTLSRLVGRVKTKGAK
jgi:hypothetical protein